MKITPESSDPWNVLAVSQITILSCDKTSEANDTSRQSEKNKKIKPQIVTDNQKPKTQTNWQ